MLEIVKNLKSEIKTLIEKHHDVTVSDIREIFEISDIEIVGSFVRDDVSELHCDWDFDISIGLDDKIHVDIGEE